MADFLKSILGGAKKEEEAPAVKKADADFADFAGAPPPAPGHATLDAASAAPTGAVPYTKWYNVHERHSLSEFKAEGAILLITFFIFAFHLLGARANRNRAKKWMASNSKTLTSEFSLIGFGGAPTADTDLMQPERLLKEKSLFEFASYASGRQNVAFMDIKLTLAKRFNPLITIIENVFGFFTDAFGKPEDILEAQLYPFDGKESMTVPSLPGGAEIRAKDSKSAYDGFVWAIVHKDGMQKLRDDRYDVSITSTRDHPKLPAWVSIMTENAEITDAMLTQELIDAVTSAGDDFEYLIISDQPIQRPVTLAEVVSQKRLFLKYRLPSSGQYDNLQPILAYFVRLPDLLVSVAHFRPEVMRKVKQTRDNLLDKIKKALDEEKNEERLLEREKAKKAKRDAELKGLDAKAQKRYLEKEQERQLKKSQKKSTMRG